MTNEIKLVIGSWGSYNACNDRALGSEWLCLNTYSDWNQIAAALKKQGFRLDDTEEMICRINYIEYVYLPASTEWLSPFGSNIFALQFEGIVTAYVQPFSVFFQPQTTFPYAL